MGSGRNMVVLLALGCSVACNAAALQSVSRHGAQTPTVCADGENKDCKCHGDVYFGSKFLANKPGSGALTTFEQLKKKTFKKKSVAGSIKCNVASFGGVDPLPGFYKYCFCMVPPLLETTGKLMVEADQEATADFVRRCEVVVTVADSKFLPVTPLERFCSTTDAALECKMKVSQRLKETHARDGDMGKFCSAVYDWFQGKYGMKCPKQCRKVQCKSTCMWLDAKRVLNKEDEAIQEATDVASTALNNVKALEKQVQEKEAEKKKQIFSNSLFKTHLKRASNASAAATKRLGIATSKSAKADAAALKLANILGVISEKIQNRSDTLEQDKSNIDMAKLKREGMTRSAERDRVKAKEHEVEEDSTNKQVAELNTSIAEVAKLIKDKTKVRDADAAKNVSLTGKLNTLIGGVKKSCSMLKGFIATGEDPAAAASRWTIGNYRGNSRLCETGDYKPEIEGRMVGPLLELVKNKYNIAARKHRELESVQKALRDSNQKLREFGNTSRMYESQRDESQKEADEEKREAASYAANATRTETKIKLATVKVAADTKKWTALTATQAAQMKNKTTAENTLKARQQDQQQRLNAVKKEQVAVTQAQMDKTSKKDTYDAGEVNLRTLITELGGLKNQTAAAKAQLEADQGSLDSRVKNYKFESKELEKFKPEVVKLHALQPDE